MKTMNRILTLLLAGAMALSLASPALAAPGEEVIERYNYNFEHDPLGLYDHDTRGYASAEIAALAAEYGEESEEYLFALARARIITVAIRSGNWYEIQAGPDYPHGDGSVEPAAEKKRISDYTDVAPEAWYYDAVMEASRGGLVVGVGEGQFRPESKVTVAEFAKILCGVYNLPTHVFGGPWYGPYIDAVIAAGLDFSSCAYERADEEITRGEAIEGMVTMVRALGREPVRRLTWADVQDADDCKSSEGAHSFAAAAVLDALNYGAINGTNAAHRVNANESLTRAELCRMLLNIGVTSVNSVDSRLAFEVYRQYRGR